VKGIGDLFGRIYERNSLDPLEFLNRILVVENPQCSTHTLELQLTPQLALVAALMVGVHGINMTHTSTHTHTQAQAHTHAHTHAHTLIIRNNSPARYEAM